MFYFNIILLNIKVEELEKKAIEEWQENNPDLSSKMKCPRPLIRLRVNFLLFFNRENINLITNIYIYTFY